MERRTYLKAAGGIASASTIGGLAVFGLSGSAAATASGSIEYDDVTITSDDGTVEYVAIFGDSVIEWDGFDAPAQYFDICIDGWVVDTDGAESDVVTLHDTGLIDLGNDDWGNYDESHSGPGTSGTIESGVGLDEDGNHDPSIDWHVVGDDPDGYGLPQNSIDPSLLSVDEDGGTDSFTVKIKTKYTWYDGNEDAIFEESWTSNVNVTVKNEPKSASAGDGDGEDGAVGA